MTPSPCKQICKLDSSDVCLGCGRTRAEIGGWMSMSDALKRETITRAQGRLRTLAGAEALLPRDARRGRA